MLEDYKKKRKFEKTPEPTGGAGNEIGGVLHFVVQKHQARQLHYDFRLEHQGVLKSWAVPKGPTLDPNQKHLAQMVEDHPFEYRNFEGVIPKGNYGAGTVMVWDEGTFFHAGAKNFSESEKLMSEGLAKGHISVYLQGKKLCGEFALVRLKRAGEASWLLIKAHDECATEADITKQDKSAKTGRTMEEIADSSPKEGDFWASPPSVIPAQAGIQDSKEEKDPWFAARDDKTKKAKVPKEVNPMMATLIKEAFDDPNWIFEIKWDGYRAITEIDDKNIRIYSRNNKDFNEKFPEILHAFKSFDKNAVFDGEIVAVDEEGRPSFQLLQDYLLKNEGNLIYYVFDLLYYDGQDLTSLPLGKRREILQDVLPKVPNIQFSEDIVEKGVEFFEVAKKQNLEGIIGKRVDSIYQMGKRSKDWVKVKNLMMQEFVIGGFTAGRGARELFGALVLGVYKNGELVYVSHTGGGFDEEDLKFVYAKMKPLVQKESPFVNPPKTNAPVTWVKPELVCEVKFQEWTIEGGLRQPIFLGLREDKPAKEVIKEMPK